MEGLSRLVAESLARHGMDRPVDYRRLHWSRWFRCESPHSLLFVPSRPGVFALAEEIMSGGDGAKRMLAVLQFGEDDDMAFVLDRMFSRQNPMRNRLASGRCFVRFVVIEDESQRRSIATALNQWLVTSGEKASGIGAHFASSLELTPANGTTRVEAGDSPANAYGAIPPVPVGPLEPKAAAGEESAQVSAPQVDSGAATNLHCPQPLPSGF
ncbi:MAG TPA: hypothetical protein VKR60_07985 [Candidatus Sulfotelmatobacter sp.]|nr:hypothetical protein [Candidatus Sulfotelmatobacter sp.]